MRWAIAIIVFVAAEVVLVAYARSFECGGKAPVHVEAPVAAPGSLGAAMIAAAIAKRWTTSAQTHIAQVITYWLLVLVLVVGGGFLYLVPHICR